MTQFAFGSGTQLNLPARTPPSLPREAGRLAGNVFGNGYLAAMRWTMILPVAVVALAALTAFALRNDRPAKDAPGENAGSARHASAPS